MSAHSSEDLPTLTVNRAFVREVLTADQPCCGLGVVEVQQQESALIALRPNTAIPSDITSQGFGFGHALIGNRDFEVIHFGFEFYGYQTYHVLINPNNPIVQRVLQIMIQKGDYFILALEPSSGNVTAFRSELKTGTLRNLTENWERIQRSTTTDEQYLQAAIHFVKNPQPPGEMLQWVCGETPEYLDLSYDRLEMKSA